MKNVEPYLARDLGHLDRERQRVIGIGKEAVFVNHDLVEEDSRLREVETNGQCRAEKIDFVPALRELRAEGGREDAAPADQRITGNANLESRRSSSILEETHRRGELGQICDQQVIRPIKRLRVFDAGFETAEASARGLQFEIAARAQLRLMAFHQFDPARKLFADIDADRRDDGGPARLPP